MAVFETKYGRDIHSLRVRLVECQADRNHYRALVAEAARALKLTGICGIYADFTDLADAIEQFGLFVKEAQAKRAALLKAGERMAGILEAEQRHKAAGGNYDPFSVKKEQALATWRKAKKAAYCRLERK